MSATTAFYRLTAIVYTVCIMADVLFCAMAIWKRATCTVHDLRVALNGILYLYDRKPVACRSLTHIANDSFTAQASKVEGSQHHEG